MKANKFSLLFFLVMTSSVWAADDSVVSISNGACWISGDEVNLKFASFNEKLSFNKNYELVQGEVEDLLNSKNYFPEKFAITKNDVTLHCGGYGSSIVFKLETNLGPFCLWAKVLNNSLSIRSFGSVDTSDVKELCTGRRWGELIVGIPDVKTLEKLKTDYSKLIKSIDTISVGTYKITLTEDYVLKEAEVVKILRNDFSEKQLRYVEFNEFAHPIGDFIKLK